MLRAFNEEEAISIYCTKDLPSICILILPPSLGWLICYFTQYASVTTEGDCSDFRDENNGRTHWPMRVSPVCVLCQWVRGIRYLTGCSIVLLVGQSRNISLIITSLIGLFMQIPLTSIYRLSLFLLHKCCSEAFCSHAETKPRGLSVFYSANAIYLNSLIYIHMPFHISFLSDDTIKVM